MKVGPPRHIKPRMGSTKGMGEILRSGGKGILQRKMARPSGFEAKKRLERFHVFEINTTDIQADIQKSQPVLLTSGGRLKTQLVHGTTQWKLEYRIREGFGNWLQLVHWADLLLHV